jgi:hypothetical protein
VRACPRDRSALSLLSLFAAVAVFLLFSAFAALVPVRRQRSRGPRSTTAISDGVTLASPSHDLAVRPMSDLPGLTLALAAQACLLTAWWWQTPEHGGDRRMTPETLAASGRMIVLGALVAGVAVGLRTQTLWLSAPLLALVLVDRIGRGVAGAIMGAAMTFTIGGLIWGVPLLIASGGLQGYLTALGTQAGEDFAGGEMLYLNPAPRLAAFALLHTFVDPWEWVPLAGVVLALAALGGMSLLLRDRRSLAARSPWRCRMCSTGWPRTRRPRYAVPLCGGGWPRGPALLSPAWWRHGGRAVRWRRRRHETLVGARRRRRLSGGGGDERARGGERRRTRHAPDVSAPAAGGAGECSRKLPPPPGESGSSREY